MRYSCHLVAWPRLHEGLDAAARLGFAGCEAFVASVLPYEGREDELREVLGALGLRLSALYADLSLSDAATARRGAAMLARVGTDRLVVTAQPAGAPLTAVAALLDDGATLTEASGGALCLHPHLKSAVELAEEADAVLRMTHAPVLLCADTGHLARRGSDPAATIRRWGPRLGAVHLEDVDRGGGACPLGRGVVDVEDVLTALDEVGYGGWLTVEMEGAADPDAAVAACRDELARLGRWSAVAT